jgi:hypothetical protein
MIKTAFKNVTIHSAGKAGAEDLAIFNREAKKIRLLANIDTSHPVIVDLGEKLREHAAANPPKESRVAAQVKKIIRSASPKRGKATDEAQPIKMPLDVEMLVGPAMVGLKIGNGHHDFTTMAYLDDLAEWRDYQIEHLKMLMDKSQSKGRHILTTSFTTAEAESLRSYSIGMAASLASALYERTGFHFGTGPSDVSSIMIYEQIARGSLMQTKEVKLLIDSLEVEYSRDDQEKDAGRKPADPAPLDMQPIVF